VIDAGSLTTTTALITGATGFIGTHLANHLVARGATVVAVVRPTTDLERIPNGVRPALHDGSAAGLADLVERASPDVAFHLAARFVAQHTAEDVAPLVLDNVLFSTQLFDALARSGCRRLVNVGTGWQHQSNAPSRPVNLYAATKQAVEDVLAFYTDATCIRAVTLKLFDTYGPHDTRPKLFNMLQRASASGQPFAMSKGEQLLDLVHVADVVNALLVAAERTESEAAQPSEAFSVPARTRYTLREVVELYCSVTGRDVQVVWGGRPYRDREVMIPWAGDPLPGWRPQIALADGLRTLVADE
jgi:nucleoside-diphosphate-sugar epimerase